MKRRTKLTLTGIWVIVALSAVVLPVVLPSGSRFELIGNPIDLALGSMIVLSLPSSLVAAPLAAFIDAAAYGFGLSPIANEYLFIWVLLVLSAVQWFWLVPKFFRNRMTVQPIDLSDQRINVSLPEASIAEFDLDGATRLERILHCK